MTKTQTEALKGWAIVLMFVHHLFGFPERIPEGQALVSMFGYIAVEQSLGKFFVICVPVFVFLSGYGLGRGKRGNWVRQWIRRSWKFLVVFWVNVVILLGITLLLFGPGMRHYGSECREFSTSVSTLAANLTLVKFTYSGEWWFAKLYIYCLIFVWPICYFVSKPIWLLPFISGLLLVASIEFHCLFNLLRWQATFVAGWIAATRLDKSWTALLKRVASQAWWWKALVVCVSFFGVYVLRSELGAMCDFVLIPLFLIAALGAQTMIPGLETAYAVLGQHSTSMWLNHTFFFYYWFSEQFYSLRYTVLVFVGLLVCSYSLARLTDLAVEAVENVRAHLGRMMEA